MAVVQPIDSSGASPADGSPVRVDVAETDGEARRRELGAFLRSRRERMTPDQVGLPHIGRRRTPGLRREEVASLAGVGVTWYTWLEQGRDIKVSGEVLAAVSRTLQLDEHERRHLFALAGHVEAPSATDECSAVYPAIRRILTELAPLPACVLNGRYDILAYNRPYATLVADLDEVPAEDHNTMVLNLTYPAWRAAVLDRDAVARCVATFRSAMAQHVSDPVWNALVRRLRAESPEFVEIWERYEVRGVENDVKVALNPQVGLLRLHFTNLWLAPASGTRLVVYSPADAGTEARLAAIAGESAERRPDRLEAEPSGGSPAPGGDTAEM